MQWWHILLIVLGSLAVLLLLTILFYKPFFKRFWDIVISFLGILFLWLPMLIIAIIVKCDSKGPALFKQRRLGKKKKQFTVLKFRTMCDHAYEKGGIATSESDNRITKVGKFLRRTSIDEIPQLFNIFVGHMSIIGPRPVLDWEYEEYKKEEFEPRFSIRPGLFCTIDVTARNAERDIQFKADADYSKDCSMWLDIKTFFKVIKTVVTGKGVYRDEKDKDEEEK